MSFGKLQRLRRKPHVQVSQGLGRSQVGGGIGGHRGKERQRSLSAEGPSLSPKLLLCLPSLYLSLLHVWLLPCPSFAPVIV